MPSVPIREGLTFDGPFAGPQTGPMSSPATLIRPRCLRRQIRLSHPADERGHGPRNGRPYGGVDGAHGGIGVVHRNMTPERQAEEVDKVKRSESGISASHLRVRPGATVGEVRDITEKYHISGVPVTDDDGPPGGHHHKPRPAIQQNWNEKVDDVMTKTNLVTVPVGTDLETAKSKTPREQDREAAVVDDDYRLAA